MANSNVRFYKLSALPNFEAKHKGIFVHVTGTMHNTPWDDLSDKEKPIRIDPKELLITTPDIFLDKWLEKRHITQIASGLWFGGENGWELLSNDTTSGAINAAIEAKINTLNAGGFTQATIGANTTEGSESATGSTLTIKGIKELKGQIEQDNTKNVSIAIDGVYNETSNKIATKSTVTTAVTTAINNLNANTVQAVTFNTSVANGNTTLTFKGVKEENGVIAQGDGATNFIVGDAKLNIEIGTDSFEVFSANAKENKSIYLDKNVFKKNVVEGKNVLSVITKNNDVSSDNPLVTEKDIASLGGAMHYKGALTGAPSGDGSWPSTVAAGDVYIVTTSFTHSDESNPFEVGDMIVFNTDNDNSKFTVVQSNLTLGTGIGQVAANSAVLADGNLVVATDNGIKTTDISATVLEASNNTRDLTYSNVTGGITITDSLKIMNRDFNESINITSTNRSIKIAANASENATNVVLDLVWNTIIE